MKLSEAIRLGAQQGRQITGRTFGPDGASCAIGAALLGIGIAADSGKHYTDACDYFPLMRTETRHPVTADGMIVLSAIRDLNDHPHCWTREQIADWVETIEQPEPAR